MTVLEIIRSLTFSSLVILGDIVGISLELFSHSNMIIDEAFIWN
jgi:hypothetical protein